MQWDSEHLVEVQRQQPAPAGKGRTAAAAAAAALPRQPAVAASFEPARWGSRQHSFQPNRVQLVRQPGCSSPARALLVSSSELHVGEEWLRSAVH